METYNFVWSIGIIGILINVVGGIWYFLALRDLGGELKKSQTGMMVASMIWLAYSVLLIVLALTKTPLTENIWYVIPIAYTLTAAIYIMGSYKLMNALQMLKK